MFTLDPNALPALVAGRNLATILCASFEDRCLGLVRARAPSAKHTLVLDPVDNGSHWESECTAEQKKRLAEIQATVGNPQTISFPLLDADVVERSRRAVTEVVAAVAAAGSHVTLLVDISAMPKVVMFPLIRSALEAPQIDRVIAVYCEPLRYGDRSLHSDPVLPPTTLGGFDRLPITEGEKLAWIPVLGFGSFFAEYIYDALREAGKLEHRVYPLVGFPGFDPSLYDRMLLDNGERLLANLSEIRSIRDQFLYAPANDPFATKTTILHAISELGASVNWVGSPLGPRPMALGMLLAAMDGKLTVLHCQARSYHPHYSSGIGALRVFPLKGC